MIANLLEIITIIIGVLVIVIALAIARRNTKIDQQKQPFIMLIGGLLGVMILILTVIFVLTH